MRKNYNNNLRKSPEGARKYVGSDVKQGRLKHMVRYEVVAGCATIFGHVRISPFLLFLRISVRFCFCLKNEFQIQFSLFPSRDEKYLGPLK